MIMGIDVGYSHTKVCTENGLDIFRSTVNEGAIDINVNSTKISFEGKDYTIGEKVGSFSVKLNKINDKIFRLCLYSAIARNLRNHDTSIELVIGLPIQYYKDQKRQLIDALENTNVSMTLNNKPINFEITKCLVFPQSAGGVILYPDLFKENITVIDIGGMTVDVAFYSDFSLQNYRTYEEGMLKLYDTVVQSIKANYGVSYDILQAEDIINSKVIHKDGEDIDCSDVIEQILSAHANRIITRIMAGIREYEISKHIFMGGGSYVLRKYLPDVIEEKNIFANADAFYRIGVERFAN